MAKTIAFTGIIGGIYRAMNSNLWNEFLGLLREFSGIFAMYGAGKIGMMAMSNGTG